MVKTISAVKARQNLGSIMNAVSLRDDQYIIERDGKPMAAMVPLWYLDQWRRQRESFFQKVGEIQERCKDMDPEELESVIDEAVEAVRGNENKKRGVKRKA